MSALSDHAENKVLDVLALTRLSLHHRMSISACPLVARRRR